MLIYWVIGFTHCLAYLKFTVCFIVETNTCSWCPFQAKRTRERTPTPGKYCGRRGMNRNWILLCLSVLVVKYAMFYSLVRKEEFIFLNILSLIGYLLVYSYIFISVML
jgi:hypothetical protein